MYSGIQIHFKIKLSIRICIVFPQTKMVPPWPAFQHDGIWGKQRHEQTFLADNFRVEESWRKYTVLRHWQEFRLCSYNRFLCASDAVLFVFSCWCHDGWCFNCLDSTAGFWKASWNSTCVVKDMSSLVVKGCLATCTANLFWFEKSYLRTLVFILRARHCNLLTVVSRHFRGICYSRSWHHEDSSFNMISLM